MQQGNGKGGGCKKDIIVKSRKKDQRKGKRKLTLEIDRMTWDKETLKNEVESKKDGEKINWSELARRYHVTNKRGEIARNSGQIVHELFKVSTLKACQTVESKTKKEERARK